MADSSDTMNAMIANFAVLEQLVINLTHIVSEDFEEPASLRAALMQDIRERFNIAATTDAGTKALYELATKQLDRLEPRIIGTIGDATRQ